MNNTFAPCSLAALIASLAFASVPPQGVMGHGALKPAEPAKAPVPCFTERFGLEFITPPVRVLGPVDDAGLLMEDDVADRTKPLRFAVQRPIDLSIEDGQWIPVPGGRLWRCDVEGIGSLSARLHLSGIELGDGQELFLTDPAGSMGTIGPVTDRSMRGDGELWGVFTPGAGARIEWFIPEGSSVTALPFSSVEYSHGYRDVFGVIAQELAAQCHYDPVCYPAWSNQSNAAGRMTFTSGGASYLCSGQLMATTAADETPYFSTANHCISTQSEAASLVVQFFYRASTCNGANNAGFSVSGADLVKTYATSDCTLLMLKGTLPASVYWAGWMASNPANGTASVSIHHPGGAEQDISFCSKFATNNFCGSGAYWSEVAWTLGITEGGSSGSALYVESTQQMYGVLTCGDSSCTATTAHDAYGRWDSAVNVGGFAAPLAAGTDDALEPNDACASAKVLTAGSNASLVLKRLSSDWYAIDVAAGATLTATATFTHAYGDIDFRLYDSCGGAVFVDANGNTNNETVTWTNSGTTDQRYYLEAYLASNTRNTYSLNIALSGGGGGGGGGGGTGSVRISQVYGGGGSTSGGPTYSRDYVELFNAGDAPVDLSGWALEYGSASGTWASTTSNIFTFPTGATIQPCGYLLVASTSASSAGAALPVSSDYNFTLTLSATNGKVGLFNAVNANKACGAETAGTLVDKVSYGTANCAEGTAVAALSVTTGAVRKGDGLVDTESNAADFDVVTAPTPRNSLSASPSGCGGSACVEDLDGDATIGSSDVGLMLLDFGPCAGCTADLDGDGAVTGSDIALLLLSFGACP